MIQVVDILLTPMLEPAPNVIIRIFALDLTSDSVPTLPASETTDADGAYDFNLMEGFFSIEINYNKKYTKIVEVTVDSNTASPITLQELLNL